MSDFGLNKGIGYIPAVDVGVKKEKSAVNGIEYLPSPAVSLDKAEKEINNFLNKQEEKARAAEASDIVGDMLTEARENGMKLFCKDEVSGSFSFNEFLGHPVIKHTTKEIEQISKKYAVGEGIANISFLDETADLNLDSSQTCHEMDKFYYINGILTDYEEADCTREKLSEIMGIGVESMYNPTEGLTDIQQAIVDILDGGVISEVYGKENHELKAVDAQANLKDNIIKRYGLEKYQDNCGDITDIDVRIALDFVELLKKRHNLKIIAHSHGAAVTANALVLTKKFLEDPALFGKDAKTEAAKLLGRVDGVIFGPAAKKSDFPTATHIAEVANYDDPVAHLTSDIPGVPVMYDSHGDEFFEQLTKANIRRATASVKNMGKIIDASLERNSDLTGTGKKIKRLSDGQLAKQTALLTMIGLSIYNDADFLLDAHAIDSNYLEQERSQRLLKEFAQKDLQKVQAEYQQKSANAKQYKQDRMRKIEEDYDAYF